jgi:transglutaminase-like putative cysteine protease
MSQPAAGGTVQYAVRHVTHFTYSAPISESVMEARMRPRTGGAQHTLRFDLTTTPRARVFSYHDPLGNVVNHFDVPIRHVRLSIVAEAIVESGAVPEPPDALSGDAWDTLDAAAARGERLEFLASSRFARETPLLADLARELQVDRRSDPLTLLRQLTSALSGSIAYVPQSTHVDSSIDDALRARAGVCQDFAHTMTALVRRCGIPCRYVSGYLAPSEGVPDRSSSSAATHAWVDAWLPSLGWIGLDPTNAMLAGPRHLVVAVGCDYGDVPPTRGIYKGEARSHLAVSVTVTPSALARRVEASPMVSWPPPESVDASAEEAAQQQQQQQQQQQ